MIWELSLIECRPAIWAPQAFKTLFLVVIISNFHICPDEAKEELVLCCSLRIFQKTITHKIPVSHLNNLSYQSLDFAQTFGRREPPSWECIGMNIFDISLEILLKWSKLEIHLTLLFKSFKTLI